MPDVTHILAAIEQGDPNAAEQLLPLAGRWGRTMGTASFFADMMLMWS
jgi:hypothetical protein